MGLRADLRGATQARHPGKRHDDQDAAATPRPGPGAATHRADLGAVPASPSHGDHRLRLLHVETIRRKTFHVLFFIHLSTRRVVVARGHGQPDSAWVTQQARNAVMDLDDRGVSIRLLLGDHHAKLTTSFDEGFGSEGGQVLRTPIRAPKANSYAERWVQMVRVECLDWTLVGGRRHLLRLLRRYVGHDNQQRPHRSLALAVPEAGERQSPQGNPCEVRRRDVLGGLIHEYHEVAA